MRKEKIVVCMVVACAYLLLMIGSMHAVIMPATAQPSAPEEEWSKTFGGIDNDWAWSVHQTTDGGYIICGYTASYGAGNEDVYLIKTDASGIKEWERTFGGIGREWGHSILQTTDGGYIIVGFTTSYGAGNHDFYLIKTDASGIKEWEKPFGGIGYDVGYSVQQTTDGGYIIAGLKDANLAERGPDAYLIKTDANGTKQWEKTFGGTDHDAFHTVRQTTDGGYILVGYTISYGAGSMDFYLVKTDANGIKQWEETFGGIDDDWGFSVQQTTDGGYILVGFTLSYGAGDWDIYVIKADVNGIKQWERTFGGIGRERGYSALQTTDGGYIIGGYTASYGAGNHDFYLIRTDASGNKQWEKTFGGTGDDRSYSLQQTTDGGYIIGGYTTSSGAGESDVYLIKVIQPNVPPKQPSKPSGESNGFSNTEYSYSTTTTDPDGDQVKYTFDWDDGTTAETDFYNSGEAVTESYSWANPGMYNVKVKATDEHGETSYWSEPLSVTIISNPPNQPTLPSGEPSGFNCTDYSYSTSATDPDGDRVKYMFDWDDGTTSETVYFNGGESVTESHSWANPGTYNVKVRATDEHGEVSPWSESKSVTIEGIPCSITSAFWAYPDKIDQEWQRRDQAMAMDECALVALVGHAEGKHVLFIIYESDHGGIDKTYITSLSANVGTGEAVALWNATWMNDGPLQGNPEYVFDVIVDGVSLGWSENELEVLYRWGGDMPVGDPQGVQDEPQYNIIKINAPNSVSKEQEFWVKIEVSPELHTTYESSWIFLTQENIENTRLFMDKEGFKIDTTVPGISFDYLLGESTNRPFAFLDLSTAGQLIVGQLILSHNVAHSIGFPFIFSLLGFATGTEISPPDWTLKRGENYLLGLADQIEDDMIYVLEDNNLEAIPLMRQKIMLGERKNTMNYHYKLKAPDKEGIYKLTLNADYSVLQYYPTGIPNPPKHSMRYISNLAGMGSELKGLNENNNFEFATHRVYDSKTIHVGNWLGFQIFCPVDVSIIDPDGFMINNQKNEIPGAYYTEEDINGDSDLDDLIMIPDRKIGDYKITVTREPDAEDTDTYTLEVSAGDTTIVLAEKVPISEIPDQPYIIESTEEGIEDKTPPAEPIPEFTTIAIPVAAILGLVFLFRRRRHKG